MPQSLNIVSQLTPQGMGAIATLRLSGPLALAFVGKHFKSPYKIQPTRATYGDLHDSGEIIDDILLVQTAEASYEFHLHGSPWIVERFFQMAERSGFARSTLTNPADVFQADDDIEKEMLDALPRVQTREALDLLLAQPRLWREMMEQQDPAAMNATLADQTMTRLLYPATVAIIGQPNAGKSTLANQLFAQKRSIEADMPGTTRDWVGERANIDGLIVTLVDTPGLRQTSDPIEARAIDQSRSVIAAADVVVLVCDATQPFEPQMQLASDLANMIIVLNKIDLGPSGNRPGAVPVNASAGIGIDALRTAILQKLGVRMQPARALAWTDRQRRMLLQRPI